jgi:TolB protein
MKKGGFFFFAFLALAIHSARCEEAGAPPRRVAFVRDTAIWTANLNGTKLRKLIDGDDPCISPDGTKVAFTMSPSRGKENMRYIAVAEIATGETNVFKEPPSDNCFGPVWSPDGAQITFEIFVQNRWRLALVNADGRGFRFLELPSENLGWWSVTWAPDGKSIFCQDLEKICRFSLDGEVLASWGIQKTIPKGVMDSSKRLSVSDDGKRLLININMDEDVSLKDWEGPPPAIWLFDMPSGRATRLTPKKSYASDSCWVNDSEFLLVDADRKGKWSSIYRASISGGKPQLVIKNAADPSVAKE